MSAALSKRQKRFVEEYLADFNAPSAYRRAGYTVKNQNVADAAACKLLRHPKIQACVQRAMAIRPDRIDVHPDMVIQQLARIAFADIRDFVEWDEFGLWLRQGADVDGTAIAEITQTVQDGVRTVSIKMSDRTVALETLARHFGLLKDKTRLDVTAPRADAVKWAMAQSEGDER